MARVGSEGAISLRDKYGQQLQLFRRLPVCPEAAVVAVLAWRGRAMVAMAGAGAGFFVERKA